mgnify:CR=1 FL=1
MQINQVALNKLLEIFAYENVCGVTGNTINDNVKEIVALKDLCRENDIPIESFQAAYKWEDFKKNSDGMVPVIVQDYRTQEVLMMAYMNEEAYEQTLKLGQDDLLQQKPSGIVAEGPDQRPLPVCKRTCGGL